LAKRPASAALEDTMTTEQKIIRPKVGLLELASRFARDLMVQEVGHAKLRER
jgi:hypothetical protein